MGLTLNLPTTDPRALRGHIFLRTCTLVIFQRFSDNGLQTVCLTHSWEKPHRFSWANPQRGRRINSDHYFPTDFKSGHADRLVLVTVENELQCEESSSGTKARVGFFRTQPWAMTKASLAGLVGGEGKGGTGALRTPDLEHSQGTTVSEGSSNGGPSPPPSSHPPGALFRFPSAVRQSPGLHWSSWPSWPSHLLVPVKDFGDRCFLLVSLVLTSLQYGIKGLTTFILAWPLGNTRQLSSRRSRCWDLPRRHPFRTLALPWPFNSLGFSEFAGEWLPESSHSLRKLPRPEVTPRPQPARARWPVQAGMESPASPRPPSWTSPSSSSVQAQLRPVLSFQVLGCSSPRSAQSPDLHSSVRDAGPLPPRRQALKVNLIVCFQPGPKTTVGYRSSFAPVHCFFTVILL